MDYSDTLKQKDIDWQVQLQKALNGVNLQYQQQQYQMKNQYGSSGSGRNTQKNQNKQESDEFDTGITTKRMQVAANAAQGQQSRGSDEQTIYNSMRLPRIL